MGEEVEKEIRYGIKAEEVLTTIENEDGTETTVTETIKTMDPNLYSDYARFLMNQVHIGKKIQSTT